jgi:hypothetical protein
MDTIQKNTEILIAASREVGVEINVVETSVLLLYRHKNTDGT